MTPGPDRDCLYLLSDGFGGHGGIALYNRDLLAALSDSGCFRGIEAVPRIAAPFSESLPPGVRWRDEAAGSLAAYLLTVFAAALRVRAGAPVVCAHLNLLPFAVAAKVITGGPLILALYGTEAWTPPASRARRLSLRAVDQVYAISAVTLDRFVGWSGFDRDRAVLLPNAIALDAYGDGPRNAALAAQLRLGDGPNLLIFGRMHPTERQKGFDELLQALPLIRQSHPGATAILAGDGGDRPRLEAKAAELGVAHQVRFTGRVAEEDKADLYRLADAYVMPSYQEGFGFVHLEALACGTPTVASETDGSREAVRDGALGELVNPHDPQSIAAGVTRALARPRGVPRGLDYFAYPAFAARVRAWLDRIP